MIQKIGLVILLCFWLGCQPNTVDPNHQSKGKKPKNIILMIGDGMGLSQTTAGMYSNGNMLNIERCTTIGLQKTHAANNLITDSAASATAIASGKKTYNGAIGVDSDKQPVQSILEMAEEEGLATGLVSTSSITHATPASFIAHQPKRTLMEAIAADFLNTEIDLIIGGGKKYFDNRKKDKRELSKELMAQNYQVSHFAQDDLETLEFNTDENLVYFTANAHPLPAYQGRDYLKKATEIATDFLDKHTDNGFFLMIEGAQIDWGGHAENSEYIITEVLDFDKAVAAVIDFAEQDGETLVIITADHETGGYGINKGSTMDSLVTGFTTNYHTATMVPVYTYGPSAELFGGIYENTAIHHKMKKAFGFKP